jgi:TonB-dependent receptor
MTMYTKQKYDGWYNWGGGGEQLFPDAPVVNVIADYSGNSPSVSYTGDVSKMAVASNYFWGAAMDHVENNFAHNWTARADASYVFGANGLAGVIKSMDFGFRTDLRSATTRQSNWNWVGTSWQTWYIWTGASTANMLSWVGDITTQAPAAAELYKMNTFFGKEQPAMWFPKSSLEAKGGIALWNVFGPSQAGWAGSGTWAYPTWKPLAVGAGCTSGADYYCNAIYTNTAPGSTSQTAGINSPKEDTYAGYFQLNYGHDTFLGTDVPVDGNIGVRVVQTQDNSGPGYFLYPTISSSSCAVASADLLASCNFISGVGTTHVAGVSHTYTDILPSFNFRARLTDQVQLRGAFSQQIVRPDFAFMQNYTTLGYTFGSGLNLNNFAQCTIPGTGSLGPCLSGQGGNPNLKPLHANNYDVSIEWYFAPTGNLSFAMFHKDIANYFATGTKPETYTHNGVTQTFYVQRYYNGDKGRVEGFELAYQQFYDSLPGAWGGLGLQANYTKIYNSGGQNPSWNITSPAGSVLAADSTLPLEGMSNDSYNVAAMYEKYGISARLAYNWRSGFLMTTSAANLNQPVWQEKFGQIDASIFYTFFDHYKIGVQGVNLLKAKTFLDVGGSSYHPRYEWVDADRKLSVVLRASW